MQQQGMQQQFEQEGQQQGGKGGKQQGMFGLDNNSMFGGDNSLDAGGITNSLKNASDAQVCSIVASVCSSRPRLQDKILELLVQPPAPRCSGIIKSYFPEKAYGFIDSPDTFALYQRDVFLSAVQMGQPPNFVTGQQVSFVVTLGKNGQPQAQDLQDDTGGQLSAGGGGGMQMQQHMGGKGGMQGGMQGGMGGGMNQMQQQQQQQQMGGMGGGQPNAFQMQAQMNRQMSGGPVKRGWDDMGAAGGIPPVKKNRADPSAPRTIGVIKNFNLEKKFGFIECPETFEQFGRDVYLSNMQIGSFQPGTTVSFAITVSAQGHPQAQDLQHVQDQSQGNGMQQAQMMAQQQLQQQQPLPPQQMQQMQQQMQGGMQQQMGF